MRHPLPPVPLVLAFVNCINLRDLPGLVSLMSPEHRLQVFDEVPVVGRDVNERAWAGYFESFPSYLIYPQQIAEIPGGVVATPGYTTGSHLGLTDAEEAQETLIWVAETAQGTVASWTLVEDTPINRGRFRLQPQPKSAPPAAD